VPFHWAANTCHQAKNYCSDLCDGGAPLFGMICLRNVLPTGMTTQACLITPKSDSNSLLMQDLQCYHCDIGMLSLSSSPTGRCSSWDTVSMIIPKNSIKSLFFRGEEYSYVGQYMLALTWVRVH